MCGGGTRAGGNLPLRRGQRRSAPAAPVHKNCAQQELPAPHKSGCKQELCMVIVTSQVKTAAANSGRRTCSRRICRAGVEKIEQHASCTSLSRPRRAAVADCAAAG